MFTLDASWCAFKRQTVPDETVIEILRQPRGARVRDLAAQYGLSEFEIVRIRRHNTDRYRALAKIALEDDAS